MKLATYGLITLIGLVCSITCYCQQITLTEGGANNSIDSNKSELCFVWVENARVRKEPDLKAEVITQIKGGEKLTLTGEKSTNKIKVKLRGVDFEDVWVKIKTTDAKEGWVFSGMLTDNEIKAKAMNDFLIVPGERVGQIKFESTQKEMEELFGKEFVSTGGRNYWESEEIMPGFTVFKNSPFQVECTLDDSNKMFLIRILNENTFWQTVDSIKIGTILDKLVKINGKPIELEDNRITSYNGGALEKLKLTLFVSCKDCPDRFYSTDFSSSTSFSSTALKGKGIEITSIQLWRE